MPDNPQQSPQRETVAQAIEDLRTRQRRHEEMTTKNLRLLKSRIDTVTQQVQDLGQRVTRESPAAETAYPIETPMAEQEFPAITPVAPVPAETDFPDIQTTPTSISASPGVPSEPVTINIPEPSTVSDVEPIAQPPEMPEAAPVAPAPVETPAVTPVQRAPVQSAPVGGPSELEQLIFDQDLAYYESLDGERQALVNELRQGLPTAMTLAGQILIFRAADRDRMPGLLKDVGEAYYRWRPNTALGDDPMRDALVAWLTTRCRDVGVGNTLALVHVGDRYDSSRHNAKSRGVEIEAVFGWVVLRDNGKVYSKASVEVK